MWKEPFNMTRLRSLCNNQPDEHPYRNSAKTKQVSNVSQSSNRYFVESNPPPSSSSSSNMQERQNRSTVVNSPPSSSISTPAPNQNYSNQNQNQNQNPQNDPNADFLRLNNPITNSSPPNTNSTPSDVGNLFDLSFSPSSSQQIPQQSSGNGNNLNDLLLASTNDLLELPSINSLTLQPNEQQFGSFSPPNSNSSSFSSNPVPNQNYSNFNLNPMQNDSNNMFNSLANQPQQQQQQRVDYNFLHECDEKPAVASQQDLCVICRAKIKDSALYQCGHVCVCFSCGKNILMNRGKCPTCSQTVEDCFKVYN